MLEAMSDLYVKDILGARPSLAERARAAAREAHEAEQQRRYDEEQDLMVEACSWLREKLDCAASEVEDIEFVRGPKSNDGVRRMVNFSLDGVRLRAYFVEEEVASYTTDGSRREKIMDRVLEMQACCQSGSSWSVVNNLADVGEVIS